MMRFIYLACLIVSFAGMVVLDKKYCLAYFLDSRRTVLTIVISTLLFVIWDIFGIGLGIFYSGHSPYMSGVYLWPDFPVEELLFLAFLSYITLISYRGAERLWPHI